MSSSGFSSALARLALATLAKLTDGRTLAEATLDLGDGGVRGGGVLVLLIVARSEAV
jgi:hypothetical protein